MAEHGDAQRVRRQMAERVTGYGAHLENAMTIVAPILDRAERAEADLAAERQKLDRVRDEVRRLPSYEHDLDGHTYVRLADLLAVLDETGQ
jgi:hypothetical protein